MSLIESIVSALPWRGRSQQPADAPRERRALLDPRSTPLAATVVEGNALHADAHAGLRSSHFLRTTPHSDRCRPAAHEAGSDFLRPSMRSRCPA